MRLIWNSFGKSCQTNRASGFYLFGFLSGSFGLGEAARHTLRRMIHNKIPVAARDVDTHDHRLGQIQEFASLLEKRTDYSDSQINLFHLNPTEFERLLIPQYPKVPLINQMNVIVPFWELPVLPVNWLPCLNAMDCILAPTQYIQEVIQNELPGKLVLHFPQSISVTYIEEPDRLTFGLPDDAFVFLCAFDIMSDIERKNPWASIAAFKKAFPDATDVRLVLKVNNAHVSEDYKKLQRAVADDPRIVVITETLSRETLQKLYASCDALISLHRAEGLGLCIMEMMAQAKPVITTAWSGNMDFTTSENACLVNFHMVPVESDHPAYEHAKSNQNVFWAEADTDTAANWMKKLASDSLFCEQLGLEARKNMIDRAAIDCSIIFDQILDFNQKGLTKTKAAQLYFKKLVSCQIRPQTRRQRIRRIEQFVKRIIRRKIKATNRPN